MSDIFDVKKRFWSRKIKKYQKIFDLVKGYRPFYIDQDIEWVCNELEKKYGQKSVFSSRRILHETIPATVDWPVTLRIQKGRYEKIDISLSNICVNFSIETSFRLQIEQTAGALFHLHRREEIIELFDALFDDYEKNMEELEMFIMSEEKIERLRQIESAGVYDLIPKVMAKTNYEWNLVEDKACSVLQIKAKRGKMIEISLDHKAFRNKIPDMTNVIEQTESYLDSVPYPINIRNCGKTRKLGVVKKEINESQCKSEFWNSKLKEYQKQFCLCDKQSVSTNSDMDMEYIASELKKKFGSNDVSVKHNNPAYKKDKWFIMLRILRRRCASSSVSISNLDVVSDCPTLFTILIGYDCKPIWCNSTRRDEILSLFYKVHSDYNKNLTELAIFMSEMKNGNKLHQIAVSSLEAIIPKIMAKTSYEWNLVEEKTRSVLHIKTKRGKMIEISLGHKTFQKLLPDMIKVIEQTERYLDSVPYPVNIKNCSKSAKWRKGEGV